MGEASRVLDLGKIIRCGPQTVLVVILSGQMDVSVSQPDQKWNLTSPADCCLLMLLPIFPPEDISSHRRPPICSSVALVESRINTDRILSIISLER